jgi:uncharacterized protein (DUF1919 family)
MEDTKRNLELREEINKENRSRLKNSNFSVIASNCNGAFILHDLGVKFNSPTVNLFLYPTDFLKLLKNLKYYMSLELEFVKKDNIEYPVGKLDDILLYFMHYESEQEAKSKWNERKLRINYDNLFIIMTDRDGCTKQDLEEFDKLDYKNKIIFTHINYPNIKSSVYIKGFENESQIGHIYEFKNENTGEKYYDDFDYVSWFNSGL